MMYRVAILFALLAFAAGHLHAEERIDFSSPFAGAAGAGAAMGRGSAGAYYNPANAASRPWERSLINVEFHLPVNFSASIQGTSIRFMFDTVKFANELHDRFADGTFQSGGGIDSEDIQFAFGVFGALDRLSSLNGEGVYTTTSAGIGARFTNLFMPRDGLTINVGGFSIGGASPIVDLESLRGYRLTDESAAEWEALVGEAIINSGGGAPAPSTPAGQVFSGQLQAGGYSPGSADALAAWAEESGIKLDGTTGELLLDFLLNTLNGTGQSLESGANPLEGNESGFLIRGLAYYELGIQYGFGVPLMGMKDWLSVGVGVKFIQAYTFSELLLVENMTSNGIRDTLENLGKKTRAAYEWRGDAARFNVGFDLGVVLTPQIKGLDTLAISLTGRNINGPEFRWSRSTSREPSLVRFDPQVTFGAAYTLFNLVNMPLTVAFEADLNRIPSHILPRYHQQFVRFGAAWEPSWGNFGFGLRAGVLRNIADAEQAFTATAGFGFRLWYFTLDFAGMMAFEDRNFGTSKDFEPIPQRFGFSAQLGFRVGF